MVTTMHRTIAAIRRRRQGQGGGKEVLPLPQPVDIVSEDEVGVARGVRGGDGWPGRRMEEEEVIVVVVRG